MFASSATGSYIRAVPATSSDPAAASQQNGFPSLTFTPTGSGGVAPDGRDFNGILNQITAWNQWQQAGGPIVYDATFQGVISGYPKGALVTSATTPGLLWMSTTENNTTNPDSSGAGWTGWTFGSGLTSAVTSITAGLGLSGGAITSTGTIALLQASTGQLGGVKVDGTSITISGSGVISSTPYSGIWPIANGGTGSATLAGANIAVKNVANTFTGQQTLAGTSSVIAAMVTNAGELTTISATAATGTIAYYVASQSVLYYTANASANWTLNIAMSSGTTLGAAMATGQEITIAHLVTQGATAYYNNAVQIDGTTTGVTTKWQGGAPSSGNVSGIDAYTYSVIKTGSGTYTVLASQTPFR